MKLSSEKLKEYMRKDELSYIFDSTVEKFVKQWRKYFKLSVKDKFSLDLSKKKLAMNIAIIKEELEELEKAIQEKDTKEVLDAIGDFEFTKWQLYSDLGVNTNLVNKIVKQVFISNMSKGCRTKEEVEATIKHYNNKGIETIVDNEDPNFMLVFQNSGEKEGKLLKNVIRFEEPDFEKIIKELN